MTETTTTTIERTQGIVPAVNDIVAGAAVLAAYVTRYGVVAEGGLEWWHLPLVVTTDFLLPVFGALWLLCLPTWLFVQNVRE